MENGTNTTTTTSITTTKIPGIDSILAVSVSLAGFMMLIVWFTLQCYRHTIKILKCKY